MLEANGKTMIPRRRAKFDPPKIIACLGGTPQLLLVQKLYGQRRGEISTIQQPLQATQGAGDERW
jgi:hypothetical protein